MANLIGLIDGKFVDENSQINSAQDKILYVGKHGSDLNDGKTPDRAFLTIAAASAVAGDWWTIKGTDGEEYVENLVFKDTVDYYFPNATLTGYHSGGADSRITFNYFSVPTGQTGFTFDDNTSPTLHIKGNNLILDGNANGINGLNGYIDFEFGIVEVGEGSFIAPTTNIILWGKCNRINVRSISDGCVADLSGAMVFFLQVEYISGTYSGSLTSTIFRGTSIIPSTAVVIANKIECDILSNCNGSCEATVLCPQVFTFSGDTGSNYTRTRTYGSALANGTPTLDSTGVIPLSQIPAGLITGLTPKGVWDCSTTVYPVAPSEGDFYFCSVAGTILGTNYTVGDMLLYAGGVWSKIDSYQNIVSVNGKTGVVILDSIDVGADPAGTALGLMATHNATYVHADIAHSNRADLDLVSGSNTGDQDLSGKADKVGSAVSGNLAGLDAGGNLTDSGYDPSDFANPTGTTNPSFTIDSDSSTGKIKVEATAGIADKAMTLTNAALTDDRVIQFKDESGVVALMSDVISTGHIQNTDTGTNSPTWDIDTNSNLGNLRIESTHGSVDKRMTITNTPLTDDRTITFKDASGTVAFMSDVGNVNIHWKEPVLCLHLKGYLSDPTGLTPTLGDNWVVGSPGEGVWSGLTGHLMEWNGTSWDDFGDVLAAGFSYVVDASPVTLGFIPFAWGHYDNGTGYTFISATDGMAVVVQNVDATIKSMFANKVYLYESTTGNEGWNVSSHVQNTDIGTNATTWTADNDVVVNNELYAKHSLHVGHGGYGGYNLNVDVNGNLNTQGIIDASAGGLQIMEESPMSETSPGNKGEITYGLDDGVWYLYICVEVNTWRRTPLTI